MKTLPFCRASALDVYPEAQRWLIEGLWAAEAVGIVGGEPKCCKSFLVLDMAVSVASGAPCLRHFTPTRTGAVLLVAAEDALHVVRQRLEGIAAAAGTDLASLDIFVVTADSVRLDDPDDRERLLATVASVRPVLVILDPFVRLHRIDENAASEVAPLLAFLRTVQRRFSTAVALVHHARKGAAAVRAGQALRGSSELHAWGDSNLYLRRVRDQLLLSIEQRAAASHTGLPLALHQRDDTLALRLLDSASEPSPPAAQRPSSVERVLEALSSASGPVTRRELRAACRIRTASLSQALATLRDDGRVVERDGRFSLPGA
jgi:AAA domain